MSLIVSWQLTILLLTSAFKGASSCLYQSIFDFTYPAMHEMLDERDTCRPPHQELHAPTLFDK